MQEYPPVLYLMGPTASGKTDLAVKLCQHYPFEIISVDSAMVYRGMNIGTAKPTAEENARVTTRLVDVIEPGERYSAFRFITDANEAIRKIFEADRFPVVVGGTGLYMWALSEGVVEIENDDMAIRDRLEREMEEKGAAAMYERLENIDPLEAARIHPHNKKRIIRALEIYYLTGKTKSELVVTGTYRQSEYEFAYFCLAPEREKLYEIINKRVDIMLEAGWLEEIRSLIDRGLTENVRKANVIGYNELLDYIEGNLNLEEAVLLIKQNTRRYAKRQMTWFRKQKDCRFFTEKESLKEALVREIWPK